MSPQPNYGSYNSYGTQGYAGDYRTTVRSEQQPIQASVQQDRTRDNQASQLPVNRERLTVRSRQKAEENVQGASPARLPHQGNMFTASHEPRPREPGLGKLLGVKIEAKKTPHQSQARPFGISLW